MSDLNAIDPTPEPIKDPAADKAFLDSLIALRDPIAAAWAAGQRAGLNKWSRSQWLTLAGAIVVAVLGTLGGTSALKAPDQAPTPAPVPDVKPIATDLTKAMTDGFAAQAKLAEANTQAIVRAIEAKPVPVPLPPIDPQPASSIIPLEVIGKVGRMVTIKSRDTVNQWVIPPGTPCDWAAEGKLLILTPTDAVEFPIGVVTQQGKALTWCMVKAGHGPKPPPGPDPKPDPKPNPNVDSLYIVALWESKDSTPAISKVMKDLGFWISLEQMGAQWFQIDKDQKDSKGNYLIDVHEYRKHMTKVGLPCLIFMDRTGIVLDVTPMPDTTAKIREQVKSFMGK